LKCSRSFRELPIQQTTKTAEIQLDVSGKLYSGTSALVEDAIVEDKINSLSVCIQQIGGKCSQVDLEAQTLGLSQAVKLSLARSWGLAAQEE